MDITGQHIKRHLKGVVDRALTDTRVVAIQGARQTGKSTLARELVSSINDRYLTMDTTSVRESARVNPADFVRQAPEGMLIIDEIQRVPPLILEIKEVVDTASRPGQFLITGSSDLSALAGVQESLAGRMERVELMPFSQREIHESTRSFLSDVFRKDYEPRVGTAGLSRSDYLEMAICGGYPEALQRSIRQRRDIWFDNYIKLLFEQTASEKQWGFSPQQMTLLLSYLASISGREVIIEGICRDMAVKRFGIEQMLAKLQQLFLIELVPAWSTNLTSRAVKHPKVFLKDSGLAARSLHANTTTSADLLSPIAGIIFETFVFNELLRMASALEIRPDFYHYRDTRQREVDIVIENDCGEVLLIEVKASSTVVASDFSAIKYLLEKHPDRIVRGLVIYTGNKVLPFGDKLLALPAQCLW
jgi:predicted AAA+ superfamily ATPase